MSDVEHTYVDTNGGLGGPALGAGFGGLIGSWFGQGTQSIVSQLKTTTAAG